jgi:hypothetical protein
MGDYIFAAFGTSDTFDVDRETKEMRRWTWLRRPDLDEDRTIRERKYRTEVWELPDGRRHKRYWITNASGESEYMGAIREVPRCVSVLNKAAGDR